MLDQQKAYDKLCASQHGCLGSICGGLSNRFDKKHNDDAIVSVNAYLEVPKFCGVKTALKKLAITLNIDIKISVDKHFFGNTIFVKMQGRESRVDKAKMIINDWVKRSNEADKGRSDG